MSAGALTAMAVKSRRLIRILSHPTAKSRGRPDVRTKRRGRTLFPDSRGAKTRADHGPLQRLLDGTFTKALR